MCSCYSGCKIQNQNQNFLIIHFWSNVVLPFGNFWFLCHPLQIQLCGGKRGWCKYNITKSPKIKSSSSQDPPSFYKFDNIQLWNPILVSICIWTIRIRVPYSSIFQHQEYLTVGIYKNFPAITPPPSVSLDTVALFDRN